MRAKRLNGPDDGDPARFHVALKLSHLRVPGRLPSTPDSIREKPLTTRGKIVARYTAAFATHRLDLSWSPTRDSSRDIMAHVPPVASVRWRGKRATSLASLSLSSLNTKGRSSWI